MDKLVLTGMVFHAFHGVHAEEARLGQRFIVDLELHLDVAAVGLSDNLADAVDYGAVYKTVAAVVTGVRRNLIEAVATDIARAVLAGYPVSQVVVRVAKPQAPIKGIFDNVYVEITRDREWLKSLE